MGNKLLVNKGIPKARSTRGNTLRNIPAVPPDNSGNNNWSGALLGVVVILILIILTIVL